MNEYPYQVGQRVRWIADRSVTMFGTVASHLDTPDFGRIPQVQWDNDPEGYTEPMGPKEVEPVGI